MRYYEMTKRLKVTKKGNALMKLYPKVLLTFLKLLMYMIKLQHLITNSTANVNALNHKLL